MDAEEVVSRLGDLEDPNYGRVYIEYGGFTTSRTALYHEGRWCFDDERHGNSYYVCDSLLEALECIVSPPTEQQWEENLEEQRAGGPEAVDDQPPRRDEI